MLITHLLVNDPATPVQVLTFLAAHGLPMRDALTLATRADFPTDAPLHIDSRYVDPDALNDALTHPALPTARRSEFIAASDGLLLTTARTRDCFTSDELTAIHTRYSVAVASLCTHALARNLATPRDIAASLIVPLQNVGDWEAADLLALTHDLPAGTDAARSAAQAPDPVAAYTQHLLERGRDQRPQEKHWWAQMLELTAHPTFVTGALAHARDPRTHHWVKAAIHTAIAKNHRNAEDVRRTSANILGEPALGDLARTATADDLHWRSDRGSLDAIAWVSPNTTATHLEELTDTASAFFAGSGEREYLIAAALHPAATDHLRATAAAALPDSEPDTTLARHAAATGGQPTTALDVPYTHLDRPTITDPNTARRYEWALTAWMHTERPATTIAYTQALLALADSSFSGTLRELLATAATITTTR